MTPYEMIARLYDLGHFNNPAHPTDVTKEDLPNLQMHDKEVRTAIASYQEFMKIDFDLFALRQHGRLGIADGEVGPATENLLNMPRCGFPDHPYPEGIMQSAQEANWPGGCREKLRFTRNFRSLPNMSEEDTDKIFHGMSNNWTYALSDVDITNIGVNGSSPHIWAGLRSLSGSTLAWSYLAQNNCNVQLEQAYNTRTSWNLALAITVATHEVGHALGLPHNNDGDALMYPSIHNRSLARLGYPNNTDLAQARALGYQLSGSNPPDRNDLYKPRPHNPTPPEEPGDGEYWFSGGFTLMKGETKVGDFILVPKPQV